MNTKPVVALDADGVVLNFQKRYLQEFHAITGIPIHTDQVDRWDLSTCSFFVEAERTWAAQSNGRTPTIKSIIEERIVQPGWCESLEPLEAALVGVPALMEVADVWFVTSPYDSSPTWCHERSRSLRKHFGVHRHQIAHVGNKSRFGAHVFVDDKPAHVMAWTENNPLGRAVLFKQPYNTLSVMANTIVDRVFLTNSWDEIIALARLVA